MVAHTLSLPPTETRPFSLPAFLEPRGHHSSRAVVTGHLPLSKVNREVQVPQADKKSRPDGDFQGGIWEGFTKEYRPFRLLVGCSIHKR
jgi:hypothetical protein